MNAAGKYALCVCDITEANKLNMLLFATVCVCDRNHGSVTASWQLDFVWSHTIDILSYFSGVLLCVVWQSHHAKPFFKHSCCIFPKEDRGTLNSASCWCFYSRVFFLTLQTCSTALYFLLALFICPRSFFVCLCDKCNCCHQYVVIVCQIRYSLFLSCCSWADQQTLSRVCWYPEKQSKDI